MIIYLMLITASFLSFPLWQEGMAKTKKVLGMIDLIRVSHIICYKYIISVSKNVLLCRYCDENLYKGND